MTLTPSQLDELERKARAATPGPWHQYESLVNGPGNGAMNVADCALGSEPDDTPAEWNAALAAIARANESSGTENEIAGFREAIEALPDRTLLARLPASVKWFVEYELSQIEEP